MALFTAMFIGRSGCGKGTQANLLIKELKAKDPTTPIFYLETGEKFREFIAGQSYSSQLSRALMEAGELQPAFLAVWNWSHLLVENLGPKTHLILDGTPRKLDEAKILDSAFKFYQRQRPTLVHLKVSHDWARARLLGRGRADDQTPAAIERRLAWFETDVAPTVEFYRTNPDYRFIEVNGEQTIDQVRADLARALATALAKND